MSFVHKNFIGKKLVNVYLKDDKTLLIFHFEGGERRHLFAAGGCCSKSWIEHVEMPMSVKGATIISISNSGASEPHAYESDEDPKPMRTEKTMEDGYGGELKVYQTIFRTDYGDIAVEFRNSSNGYYGGCLVDAEVSS